MNDSTAILLSEACSLGFVKRIVFSSAAPPRLLRAFVAEHNTLDFFCISD